MRSKIPYFVILFLGVMLTKAHADQRLVSVDAGATEILIALDLGDQLVATDLTSQPLIADKALPDLGYHRALSAEGVLSVKPDLVIGSTHMGPDATIDLLQQSQISLLRLPAAQSISELIENIHIVGSELLQEAKSHVLINQIKNQEQVLEKMISNQQLSMVFLLDMNDRGLSFAGKGTTGDALIRMLGGHNLNRQHGYKSISMEALLKMNPEVILVGGRELNVDAAEQLIKDQPLIAASQAAEDAKLLHVDSTKMVAGVSPGLVIEAIRISDRLFER